MARQAILPGFPNPNYLNETGTRQAILPGIYVNETVATTTITPDSYAQAWDHQSSAPNPASQHRAALAASGLIYESDLPTVNHSASVDWLSQFPPRTRPSVRAHQETAGQLYVADPATVATLMSWAADTRQPRRAIRSAAALLASGAIFSDAPAPPTPATFLDWLGSEGQSRWASQFASRIKAGLLATTSPGTDGSPPFPTPAPALAARYGVTAGPFGIVCCEGVVHMNAHGVGGIQTNCDGVEGIPYDCPGGSPTPPPSSNAILLEDGVSYLLLETGGKILLEN